MRNARDWGIMSPFIYPIIRENEIRLRKLEKQNLLPRTSLDDAKLTGL
jgi:hypothetical protein